MSFDEHRQWPRWRRVIEHEITSIRLRPGRAATLIDVSAAGALIEAEGRLEPGSVVELQMTKAGRSITVRGRVVRSVVSRLYADAIWYRGGVAFDRRLAWLVDETTRAWGRTTHAASPLAASTESNAADSVCLFES